MGESSGAVAAESSGWRVRATAAAEDTGCHFSQWQAKGLDTTNRIADPQFVASVSRDFRLKPGSPALAMGIRSLDVSGFWPREAGPGIEQ